MSIKIIDSLHENYFKGRIMAYDVQNIFARILRGELPAIKVYEDEQVLAHL